MTTPAASPSRAADQTEINRARWRSGDFVADYATTDLHRAEAAILAAYRADLAGRVLELGCGAGRLTGHLLEVAAEVHGLDISPAMVAHCRRAYPAGHFREGDLRDLSGFASGSFGAVVAPWNVLDVLDHDGRLGVLDDIRRILVPGGLFVFSAHNRAFAPRLRSPRWVLSRHPRVAVEKLVRLPVRLRNHRRLRGLERSEAEYQIINDDAHDYSLLHYWITPEAQIRQLQGRGFVVLDTLDRDGRPIAPGDPAAGDSRVHYVARRP